MKKETEYKMILAEIAIILVALAVIGFLIKLWLDKQQEKEDIEGTVELANETVVSDDILAKYVAGVPVDKRAAVLDGLRKMPLRQIGDMIYTAPGITDDNELAVYAAFGMIKSKIQLGMFLDYFQKLYKTKLFDFLQFMDAEELNKVNQIVSKYKPY